MTESPKSIYESAPLAQPILSVLANRWPDAALLVPGMLRPLSGGIADRDFVGTVQYLNDNGFVSYDAMIIGADPDPAPRVIGALITRKGQHLLGLIDKVGP
ncbi:hypothetical protein DBR17_13195 [Sphingomonas sp. HMWF008]|nr:hypothetical protein DBR17_13195 [Sphingomonas sp. HMWF008]